MSFAIAVAVATLGADSDQALASTVGPLDGSASAARSGVRGENNREEPGLEGLEDLVPFCGWTREVFDGLIDICIFRNGEDLMAMLRVLSLNKYKVM